VLADHQRTTAARSGLGLDKKRKRKPSQVYDLGGVLSTSANLEIDDVFEVNPPTVEIHSWVVEDFDMRISELPLRMNSKGPTALT